MNIPDLTGVTTLLLDADGTLFPSEEPAFVASATVTQDFARRFGLEGDFSPEHLRLTTTGSNFRTTARTLAEAQGARLAPEELEEWVAREKAEVTAYLGKVLTPRPDVVAAVSALGRRYRLAVVSSSALTRLAACFTASGLDDLLPPDRRFSAEDSLPVPTSKPDPAVYRFALARLGLGPQQALALEDSTTGAASAVAAGITTAGLVQFVPEEERPGRIEQLHRAGASWTRSSWDELASDLVGDAVRVAT
ncbi:HAD family hydrolase [Streptomyces galbus]|uniref:HAD family phosphatase n=1 Tax=Streptomyces galbus TaxID=33898 RepID=A0A4U5W7N6_STRGB|nr:HAD family phosphatase [Streptomyces galbus]TKS97001.1 HAD family phosphatase [Streptomyces galbus]GHD51202.1 haloacid dehalogenase [Streptomyces galbus]